MAMRKILLSTCLLVIASMQKQAKESVDSLNDINAIKRDTSFIYAEATMMDVVEAQSGAHAILELKLYEWLRNKYPKENSELLVTNSKKKWHDLVTRRGKYNRMFVYVHKQDVMPDVKLEKLETGTLNNNQEKVLFIKRMYKDFFENSFFNEEKLSDILQYLTSDIAERLHDECPYDGCEGEKRYVLEFFVNGNRYYVSPDYGYRVVTRSIKYVKDDWFEITNTWDMIETPVKIRLKVQDTDAGLRVVDISDDWPGKNDAQTQGDNTIEDWEFLITPEEKKMISMVSFYEIEPYIKQLKADERVNRYGKYSTMPENDLCHLFIYNRDGDIVTVLLKTPQNTYNLKTREKDVISNYKNCGAIWFTLRW